MEASKDKLPLFDLYEQQKAYEGKKVSRTKTLIAGILLIIPGLIAIIFGLLLIITGMFFIESEGILYIIWGCFQLFFGIPSVIGGILSIKRKNHKIALMCAILSIFTLVIPGLIAVLLLFMSEDEFES